MASQVEPEGRFLLIGEFSGDGSPDYPWKD